MQITGVLFLMKIFQNIGYVALKGTVNGEMERMWKEAVVIWFKVVFHETNERWKITYDVSQYNRLPGTVPSAGLSKHENYCKLLHRDAAHSTMSSLVAVMSVKYSKRVKIQFMLPS